MHEANKSVVLSMSVTCCSQALIDKLDTDLQYAITVECKASVEDVANYEEVRDEIKAQLESLRDVPNREECPLIYHLDVAAMYPNIILTNRCQRPCQHLCSSSSAACMFPHAPAMHAFLIRPRLEG